MASSLPRWLAIGGAILIAAIAADSLVPVAWQVRAGLTEHFLAYFAVTVVFCLAFQRPLAVAGDFGCADGSPPGAHRRPHSRSSDGLLRDSRGTDWPLVATLFTALLNRWKKPRQNQPRLIFV